MDRRELAKNREIVAEFCEIIKQRVLIQEQNLTQMLSTFSAYATHINPEIQTYDFVAENQNTFFEVKKSILAEVQKYFDANPETTEEFKQNSSDLEKFVTEELAKFSLSDFSDYSETITEMKLQVAAENVVSGEYLAEETKKILDKFDGKKSKGPGVLFGKTVNLDNSEGTTNIACAYAQKPKATSTSSGVKLSQQIIFSGTPEEVNELKVMYRRVFPELLLNSDGSYQVIYGAKDEKTAEQAALLESNSAVPIHKSAIPVTYLTINEYLEQKQIPPLCMWVSPLEQRVIDFEAIGNVSKIEQVVVIDEVTLLPALYTLVIYNEGGRVMLNPDGSQVPWVRLPGERDAQMKSVAESVSYYGAAAQNKRSDELLPAASMKARRAAPMRAAEPAAPSMPGIVEPIKEPEPVASQARANPEDLAAAAKQAAAMIQEEVNAPPLKYNRTNRGSSGGGLTYPNFGIWQQKENTFCWVIIKCYENYQQGTSARISYEESKKGDIKQWFKLLMPESFAWSNTHTWAEYKGWTTPLAEGYANFMSGAGKAANVLPNIKQAISAGAKDPAGIASALGTFMVTAANGEAIQYQRFDQAKVYQRSNDRTADLDFEFALGPQPVESAKTAWKIIRELSAFSCPERKSGFSFIPPYLFTVTLYPPGVTSFSPEKGLWTLEDCALVDIKSSIKDPFLCFNGGSFPPKFYLSLSFSSIAATFYENEPMQDIR